MAAAVTHQGCAKSMAILPHSADLPVMQTNLQPSSCRQQRCFRTGSNKRQGRDTGLQIAAAGSNLDYFLRRLVNSHSMEPSGSRRCGLLAIVDMRSSSSGTRAAARHRDVTQRVGTCRPGPQNRPARLGSGLVHPAIISGKKSREVESGQAISRIFASGFEAQMAICELTMQAHNR